jgi:hypothetical protein
MVTKSTIDTSSSILSTNLFNSRSSFYMKAYAKMSNQFLRLLTTWCFTILILDATYLAFTFFNYNNLSDSNRSSCIAIAVIMHFFLICSFCFSLSITIIQYFIFYKSFKIFKFIYWKAVSFSLCKYDLFLFILYCKLLNLFFLLPKSGTSYRSFYCIGHKSKFIYQYK